MTRRAFFIWWSLILLVCFPMGWIIGRIPGGKPRAPGLAATPASVAPTQAPPARPGESQSPNTAGERPAQRSQWTTYGQALAESRQNGKPILLDFNAEWCGPCRMLKGQVFEAGGYGEAVMTAVIPVSIVDRDREEGRNSEETEGLQRQYQIEAFPTLVVFSPQSGRATQIRGYRGAEWTVAWIRNAAREVR